MNGDDDSCLKYYDTLLFLSHEKIGKLLGVKIEFSTLFLIELYTQKRVLITDY